MYEVHLLSHNFHTFPCEYLQTKWTKRYTHDEKQRFVYRLIHNDRQTNIKNLAMKTYIKQKAMIYEFLGIRVFSFIQSNQLLWYIFGSGEYLGMQCTY